MSVSTLPPWEPYTQEYAELSSDHEDVEKSLQDCIPIDSLLGTLLPDATAVSTASRDPNAKKTPEKKVFLKKIICTANQKGTLARFYHRQDYTIETNCIIVNSGDEKDCEQYIKDGPQIWRNKTGQIVRQRLFSNGKLNGDETIFCQCVGFDELQKVCSRYFENDLQQGEQILHEFHFKEHRTDGPLYNKGSRKTLSKFVNGMRHGVQFTFHTKSNRILSTVDYWQGFRQGIANIFSLKGLVATWYFANDKRVAGYSLHKQNNIQIKTHCTAFNNINFLKHYDEKGVVQQNKKRLLKNKSESTENEKKIKKFV